MKRLLIVAALCAVYSFPNWNKDIGPLHIKTQTGTVPQKYYPMTRDDKHASHRMHLVIGYIKHVRRMNPLKFASLGPYHITLPDDNFHGYVRLTKIVVNGLKRLTLSGLEVRIKSPSRIDFNVRFPRLSSEVDFELIGFLNNQIFNAHGQLSATHHNLALSAAVGAKITELETNEVYQVDSADVHINLEKLQVSMNTNQNAEDFKETVLRSLHNTPQYSNFVDDILRATLKEINHELQRITAKEIHQLLTGSSNQHNLAKPITVIISSISIIIKYLAVDEG